MTTWEALEFTLLPWSSTDGKCPRVIPALIAPQRVMDLRSLWPERLSLPVSTLELYLQLGPHPQDPWAQGGCRAPAPPGFQHAGPLPEPWEATSSKWAQPWSKTPGTLNPRELAQRETPAAAQRGAGAHSPP